MTMDAAATRPAMAADMHVDVLIIGAGVSGIGSACHLRAQCPELPKIGRAHV